MQKAQVNATHMGLSPHVPNQPITVFRRNDNGPLKSACTATHEHMALAFYTQGSARVLHGGNSFALREGDVCLVPAGHPHRLERARDAALWCIGFWTVPHAASEFALLFEPFERTRAGAVPVVHISADRQAHLAELCSQLNLEVNERAGALHADFVQKSLLGLILAEVKRAATFSPASELQTNLVGAALRFIEQRCLEKISLCDVAQAVGRSPAHVTTILRRATGKTAVGWIIAGRMAEARRLLASTDEAVDSVADRVGYADPTHFIRLFRRCHGVTPAAWRNGVRASLCRTTLLEKPLLPLLVDR